MNNYKAWMDEVAKSLETTWNLYMMAGIVCGASDSEDKERHMRVHIFGYDNLVTMSDAVGEEIVKVNNPVYTARQFEYAGVTWFAIVDDDE